MFDGEFAEPIVFEEPEKRKNSDQSDPKEYNHFFDWLATVPAIILAFIIQAVFNSLLGEPQVGIAVGLSAFFAIKFRRFLPD